MEFLCVWKYDDKKSLKFYRAKVRSFFIHFQHEIEIRSQWKYKKNSTRHEKKFCVFVFLFHLKKHQKKETKMHAAEFKKI